MHAAHAGAVGQQGLLPTHADPKLWICETRTGEEREAVVKLLQKAVNLAAQGRPLLIKSAFTQDHLKARALPRNSLPVAACKACMYPIATYFARLHAGRAHMEAGKT